MAGCADIVVSAPGCRIEANLEKQRAATLAVKLRSDAYAPITALARS